MFDAGRASGAGAGSPLAQQKLQLEVEKLQREKKAAELQTTDPASPEKPPLADEKLQLEIDKLQQEKKAAALKVEVDKGVAQSRDQLELQKLHNDLRKAKAEADAAIAGTMLRIEWAKAIGGFVTALGGIVAAIVAIITLGSAIQKQNGEEDRRFRTDAAGLIDSLGDASEAKRTAAAIALRPYTANDRTQTLAIGGLAYALGAETLPDVQQAIAASLIAASAPSLDPLKEVVSRENAIVSTDFYKVGDACSGLSPDQANALTRLRARQTAVILAAEAISRIGKSAVDLSGANLKCYPFHGLADRFDGAKFIDAVLSSASFYRKSLRNADLSRAEALNTEFTFADMTGATVTKDTNFTGALMACVTLTGAKGVTATEMERLLRSARLEEQFAVLESSPGYSPLENWSLAAIIAGSAAPAERRSG